MANDSHNRERYPGVLGGIGIEVKDPDVLTKGIAICEIFSRKTVVDDGDPLGLLIVRSRKKAAAQQRNAHGLEIVGFDDILESAGELRLARRLRLSLRPEANFVIACHRMRAPMKRNVLDSSSAANHRMDLSQFGADRVGRLIR